MDRPIDHFKKALKIRLQQYDDGLTTQGETLTAINNHLSMALAMYYDAIEDTLFTQTGKRPYEFNL